MRFWPIGAVSAAFWIVCMASGNASALASNQAAILLLLPHGCLFALGMMIANRPAAGFSPGRRVAFVGLLAVAAVEASAHVGGWRATPAAGAALTVLFGGIGVLLIAPRVQPWLAGRIDARLTRTIGLMTYPLYLIHQVAGAILLGALVRAGMPPLAAVALTIVAMLAAAWAVATIAEPWLRRPLVWLFSLGRDPAPDSRRSASLPTG
jgi:peptidoglycan/LPS O-acetylase OafA/YrhL